MAADAWRNIASSVQTQFGSTVASDTGDAGVNLVVMVRVYGFWSAIGPFYVPFDGNTSIGKAVLNHANVDKGKPDPNPCDPEENEDNEVETSTASGGGGGGGGYYGGGGVHGSGCIYGCSVAVGTTGVREDDREEQAQ